MPPPRSDDPLARPAEAGPDGSSLANLKVIRGKI